MSKKKKNWIGKIFTITGLLLFAAALALSVYNLWDGYRAEQSREKLLEEYRDKNQDISDKGEQADESDGQIPDYQLNPEMEIEITPHNEAVLNARRRLPNMPKKNIPRACDDNTNKSPANSIGNIPLLHGKCRNP